MLNRRTLLTGTAALLAAPAIVESVGAQAAFDWKQAKGTSLDVNLTKSPRADVLQANQKKFEEMTGIRVSSEAIPEQQQRPKVALSLTSGRPDFDVVNIAMHVQKRLVEKGAWMMDLRPLIADATMTSPDLDMADFSAPTMHASTGADGKINALPLNQDLFILYWNKELFARAGLSAPPATYDQLLAYAEKTTDKAAGNYGWVGRGLRNANVVLYDHMLLGWDQETITPDGHTLLLDTPAALEAAKLYQTLMTRYAPPGSIGFNWNECQTTFSQGRAAMWIDGVGYAAPLLDKTKSRVSDKVGFAATPAGPKGRYAAAFTDAIGIPEATRNKKAAWLYTQWATGKTVMPEMLRTGSGTPPRASAYTNPISRTGGFPDDWFDATLTSLKISRSGLPEIVPVTEFRDTLGIGLSNIIGGGDPKTELTRAMDSFKPILAKAS
ncbi:ABC transporter substrate-binding protein [Acidisphaera sp. L21]|uniref:ABC transporter substrate-binding protein n=1 Tax=Acidisphaera sp. L21 TaxID=1641851 RepID=UPI00131C12D4|nr:sugar ABC transporter substrate-binding protein [Acidisphaera sp. L21]